MKNNKVLYLLILVLLITNGFFLFNHLGKPNHKEPKESANFITSELKFNDAQLKQFKNLEDIHHENMMAIGHDIKSFKDELFEQITAPAINQDIIDGLMASVYENEILKEKEIFNRLRGIFELCNIEQKERFSEIIKSARRFEGKGPGPREKGPRPRRQE